MTEIPCAVKHLRLFSKPTLSISSPTAFTISSRSGGIKNRWFSRLTLQDVFIGSVPCPAAYDTCTWPYRTHFDFPRMVVKHLVENDDGFASRNRRVRMERSVRVTGQQSLLFPGCNGVFSPVSDNVRERFFRRSAPLFDVHQHLRQLCAGHFLLGSECPVAVTCHPVLLRDKHNCFRRTLSANFKAGSSSSAAITFIMCAILR